MLCNTFIDCVKVRTNQCEWEKKGGGRVCWEGSHCG
jgi:hypothetical protein